VAHGYGARGGVFLQSALSATSRSAVFVVTAGVSPLFHSFFFIQERSEA
jgi:hypothetical protein